MVKHYLKIFVFIIIMCSTIPVTYAQSYENSSSTSRTKQPTMPSYGTGSKQSSNSVRGHFKSNGTYVARYRRSKADNAKNNNWSTKGNINPRTGERGTQRGRRYGK